MSMLRTRPPHAEPFRGKALSGKAFSAGLVSDARLSDDEWLLRIETVDPAETAYAETLLHLANGHLGIRPTADLDGPHTESGFFAADVYDSGIGVSREIVNLPNPLGVRIRHGLSTLAPAGPVLRVLDIKQGLAYTRRPLTGATLSTITLLHATRPTVGLMTGTITFDDDVTDDVALDFYWDNRAGNPYLGGVIPQLRTHHVHVDAGSAGQGVRLACRLAGTGERLTMTSRYRCDGERARAPIWEADRYGHSVVARPPDRRTISFEIAWSVGDDGAIDALDAADLLDTHRDEWRRRWQAADIVIDGDDEARWSMRFAQFQLMQAELPVGPRKMSPARGLSGAFHCGATFFDTEVHKLAYWTWRDPRVARALLMYRHDTLQAARRYAAATGFLGARFPEAADDLGGETGPLAVSGFGAPPVERPVRGVVHVSACVAHAVARYHEVTGDDGFLAGPGLDLVLDTARFAASALRPLPAGGYGVLSAMGVDEYHHGVDNSLFANTMLRWNLGYALTLLDEGGDPRDVTDTEIQQWRRVATSVRIPDELPGGVPAQYDGFAQLADCPPRTPYVSPAPRLTADEAARVRRAESLDTNLIKQADAVLLAALLPDLFDTDTVRRTLRFYEPRTAHASSLSPAPHGVLAARVGRPDEAYSFFLRAARFNLDYAPRAGYRNGLHLSAYAGAWQVLVDGFLGLRVRGDVLELRPQLPRSWRSLEIPLVFRGNRVTITAGSGHVTISAADAPLAVRVNEAGLTIGAGRTRRIPIDDGIAR